MHRHTSSNGTGNRSQYKSQRNNNRPVSITAILLTVIIILAVIVAIVNVRVGVHAIITSLTQNPPLNKNDQLRNDEPLPTPVQPAKRFTYDGCLNYLPPNPTEKHIVAPPVGNVHLVCCNTTKGVFNFRVHPSWCPLGAKQFLDMVDDKFFSYPKEGVGLFRSIKDFLIQFGLSGNTTIQTKWDNKGWLKDDLNWLPLGPTGRKINGTSRYQKGYFSYAGGGKNSRGTQLILAFRDNDYLGGGSPWEVPFGQLFGDVSFTTLSKIYTGYGEKVSQGTIRNRGNSYLKQEFPLLDYMTECHVEARNVVWTYSHSH